MFNFIRVQKLFLVISGVAMTASVVLMLLWGIRPGIDFTGGSLMLVRFNESRPAATDVEAKVRAIDIADVRVQPVDTQDALLRMSPVSNEQRITILDTLQTAYGPVVEQSFSSIGPTMGVELQRKAYIAIGIVLLGILLYITWAFRKVSTGPVPAWFYGAGAIIALSHDIVLPLGLIAALGHFTGVEVDTLFITALLTILGFSVHDTIVVYDRIRENLRKHAREPFANIVNMAMNQTLTRSLNTSLTAVLVLTALYLFGGESIRDFAFILAAGISFGTYSSIFIAGPLLVIYARRRGRA